MRSVCATFGLALLAMAVAVAGAGRADSSILRNPPVECGEGSGNTACDACDELETAGQLKSVWHEDGALEAYTYALDGERGGEDGTCAPRADAGAGR